MRRKKTATSPIPERVRGDFLAAVRDLQLHGQAFFAGKRFPARVIESERSGLLSRQRHGFAIELMVRCGLRFSELRRLCSQDLRSDGLIFVRRSKGGLDGDVSIPIELAERIIDWRREWMAAILAESNWLLPARSGSQLSISRFNRMLGEFGALFGLSRLSSHSLRDTGAVLFISQHDTVTGKRTDIVEAARFLGHKKISSTEIYIGKKERAVPALNLEF